MNTTHNIPNLYSPKIDWSATTEGTCAQCGKDLGKVLKALHDRISCDECVANYKEGQRMKDIKSYWESFCPKQFLNTDPNHPDFARVWQLVKRYTDPNENLILCGASGLCKTRSALYRMKLLLAKHGTLPAVLWADDLDERLEEKFKNGWKAQYKEAQLLLVDDLFTAGASLERYTKYIKGLLDFRLREGRPTIFTTNLQARDIESDSEKFGNATKADQQRVQAIIRRLRGEFRTIDFDAGIGDGRF